MRFRLLNYDRTKRELFAPPKCSKGSCGKYKIIVTKSVKGEGKAIDLWLKPRDNSVKTRVAE